MTEKPGDDPYWEIIGKEWSHITFAYREHANKKPIIEYSLPSRIIYSYPGDEYINSLSLRTREKTRKQYQQACLDNKMMIFVKDLERKVWRSYVTEIDDD